MLPKRRASRPRRVLVGTLLGALAGAIAPASVYAANQIAPQPEPSVTAAAASEAKPAEQPEPSEPANAQTPKPEPAPSFRAAVRAMVEQEVRKTGLPADIADAVVHVESNYDPSVIGGVGEIGLMQIRPSTAAMLGFKGSLDELAKPEVNIHYGVIYLSKAWRLANGDLCRALMKYRAGHGEEIMTPLSVNYCRRARSHLAALGSPFATAGASEPVIVPASTPSPAPNSPKLALNSPKDVYARYKQGTAAASRAFWVAREARVRAINAQLEARWRRVASR
ncbi:Transglycosylase SLT domain-containing protein [Bradyrhizobium canariense]|uniref:Transglycosylase SLT domain-containing protein n=1 Tax=Bradyrhizobium canariense TaxID=255045 RepID=A0A1H1RS09_9BRAD|nr:Transglycosylase SLT domain-containing protein [Bradyrhizobium canariense]